MENQDFLKRELINTLAVFGNQEALNAAEALLEHANPAIRKDQVEFLAEYKKQFGGDPFPVIRQGLEDSNPGVKDEALLIAARFPDPRFIPLVAAVLRSGSEQERRGPTPDQPDSRKNADRRGRASRFIRSCACQEDGLLTEVARLIADAEAHTPCRLEAMEAVCYPHDLGSVQAALLEALGSADGGIRSYAARTLAWVQDKHGVAQTLMAGLKAGPVTDEDKPLYLARLTALAGLGVAESVPVLMKLLKHSDPQIQEVAVAGLRKSNATRARDVLQTMWDAMPDKLATEGASRLPARALRPVRPAGARPDRGPDAPDRPARPKLERPVRPSGDRDRPAPGRPAPGRPNPQARPMSNTDRPSRPMGDRDRPARPMESRPPGRPPVDRDRGPRPDFDRDRPARSFDRPSRPPGDRPSRPPGDRPSRPPGDRPSRPPGDRPSRPPGDRPKTYDRTPSNRPKPFDRGGNPPRDRPGSPGKPGDRGFQGGRPGPPPKGRPGPPPRGGGKKFDGPRDDRPPRKR